MHWRRALEFALPPACACMALAIDTSCELFAQQSPHLSQAVICLAQVAVCGRTGRIEFGFRHRQTWSPDLLSTIARTIAKPLKDRADPKQRQQLSLGHPGNLSLLPDTTDGPNFIFLEDLLTRSHTDKSSRSSCTL